MKEGSILLLSGFYTEDIQQLADKALMLGLQLTTQKEESNWSCLQFELKS
jgi:ribosomal protein L11 methyltransferase